MPNYAYQVEGTEYIWKWEGEYYFVDETGDFTKNGPFKTQEEAQAACDRYIKEQLK